MIEIRTIREVLDDEDRARVAWSLGRTARRGTTTADRPDVSIGVGALSAANLGGSRLRDAAIALGPAGAVEHRDGALAELEGWLRPPSEPSCSTFF